MNATEIVLLVVAIVGINGLALVLLGAWAYHRRERRQREQALDVARDEATSNFRKGTAELLQAIHQATSALVTSREPTLDEIRKYAIDRNLWFGTEGDMISAIIAKGYVVISSDRWEQIVARLSPENQPGFDRKNWIDRED